MKLFSTILADFTEEDWQEVKSEIKEFIIDQFKQMWEEQYIWDSETIENYVSDNLNDFIEEQFKTIFKSEDMKKIFMQEMLKKINGEVADETERND